MVEWNSKQSKNMFYHLVSIMVGPNRGQGIAVGLVHATGHRRGYSRKRGLTVGGEVEHRLPASALVQSFLNHQSIGARTLKEENKTE